MKKEFERLCKRFQKDAKRYCDRTNLNEFLETFGSVSRIYYRDKDKNLFVSSDYLGNLTIRKTMVNTLKDINYKREDKKWCTSNVIPFMQELMNINLNGSCNYEKEMLEISERYNVPKHRLNTQMALFIRNYENKVDKFNIDKYFSPYDIFMWKYRDISKLQKDVDEGKITKEMLDIARTYYGV